MKVFQPVLLISPERECSESPHSRQRRTYKRQKLVLDISETIFITIKILILKRMSVFYEILNTEMLWDRGSLGFPDGSDGKESACNVGDPGLIAGFGKIP